MNLVIIGGKSAEIVNGVVKTNLDDVIVSTYIDTNMFIQEASLRNLTVHRIILLQDGIDSLSDNEVEKFTNFLGDCYPSVRVITISKDNETVKLLGDLLLSSNHVHLLTTTIARKTIVDLASVDVNDLKKKYKNLIYKKVIAENPDEGTEIIDEKLVIKKDEKKPKKKSGVLGTVTSIFSKSNKQHKVTASKTTMNKGLLQPIGQNQVVNEFTEKESTIFDELPSTDSNIPENLQFEEYNIDNTLDITVFDSDESDVGLGVTPSVVLDKNNQVDDVDFSDLFIENKEDINGEEVISNESINFNEGLINEEIPNEVIPNEEIPNEEIEQELGINLNGNLDINDEGLVIEEDLDENQSIYNKVLPTPDLESLRKSIEDAAIESVSDIALKKPILNESLEEISDNIPLDLGKDIALIMQDYEEQTTKVNVKIVEKVVTVPVKESLGRRNKNGVRLILITGDRRVGSTKLAMNLANYYAKDEKTLLVDFDRYRKGMLSYMGVDSLINEPSHIQNGLNHVKNENMLSKVTYLYQKGGFYTLQSMYGVDIDDTQLRNAQQIISIQKEYTTVIIDCPIENLYLMRNLLYTSNILICIEDDRVGIINSVINLNSAVEEEELMQYFYNNSAFVVGRGSNVSKFKEEMSYVESIFGMDEKPYNWGTLDIIGTIKGTKKLAEGLVV